MELVIGSLNHFQGNGVHRNNGIYHQVVLIYDPMYQFVTTFSQRSNGGGIQGGDAGCTHQAVEIAFVEDLVSIVTEAGLWFKATGKLDEQDGILTGRMFWPNGQGIDFLIIPQEILFGLFFALKEAYDHHQKG